MKAYVRYCGDNNGPYRKMAVVRGKDGELVESIYRPVPDNLNEQEIQTLRDVIANTQGRYELILEE